MTILEDKQGRRLTVAAAFCWACGWALAVAYGHGFEFQRLVVAIPGVVLAGALILPGLWRRTTVWMPGLVAMFVVTVYFALRAAFSPVWDLGKTDLLLVCAGGVSLLAGTHLRRSQAGVRVVIGGMVVLFLVNLGVALFQGMVDPAYAFLRAPREGHVGVSGLFWHRNYLAGMLELIVPVFLAVALAGGRLLPRVGFGVLAVAGGWLAYYSQSRAGLISVGGAAAAVFFVWLIRGWHGWTKNAKLGVLLSGSVVIVILGFGVLALASKVSEKRGEGESLEGAIGTANARLAFAGLAYDQWQENPLFGTGARTFSYLSVKNWDPQRTENTMGSPEMVHSDYLQTLAEYGLLGLAGVVLVIGMGAVRGLRSVLSHGDGPSGADGFIQLGALGGICGAMMHAGVDFSLHILPNTLLFGLLLGLVFGAGTGAPGEEGTGNGESATRRNGRNGIPGRVMAVASLVLLVAGSLLAGGRELVILPSWFRFEQGVIASGVSPEEKERLRKMIQRAPDFSLARYHGSITLEELRASPDQRDVLIPEGLWAMRLAVKRHPFDAESQFNLARFLEAGDRDEEAARRYLQAIEMTWRRENKYGGMMAFSDFLGRRGEEYWLARQPGKALSCYERAKEYLARSWELGFRSGGTWDESRPDFDRKMEFLSARVRFLEGAGIRREGIGIDVPSPPGD